MVTRAFWNQQSGDRSQQFAQQSQQQALQPLLRNPVTNGIILEKVSLLTGSNTIQHKLGRKLQGWVIVRISAAAAIYDTQDTNPDPQINLVLVSSAPATVNIYVF